MSTKEHPQHVTIGSGPDQRSIAYMSRPGNAPGLFWLQGFKSEMVSIKATALADWAATRGLAYTRFDYSGHGQSGGVFEEGTISRWLEEVQFMFEHRTRGEQIIIGSSMGGYLALLLLRELQRTAPLAAARIRALVLIAPAWNMTELMWSKATPEVRRAIETDGVWYRPSRYGDDPYPITRMLIKDGAKHPIDDEPWLPGCPIDIIHGRLDPDIPYERSEQLVQLLGEAQVTLSEVPDGEHRLSRPEDLAMLFELIRVHVDPNSCRAHQTG